MMPSREREETPRLLGYPFDQQAISIAMITWSPLGGSLARAHPEAVQRESFALKTKSDRN